MRDLFSSGDIVALILAVLGAEIAALFLWHKRGNRPARFSRLVTAALPGIFLLLALRSALRDEDWTVVALWLAASFPAHLIDLWRRPP
jgi:hypothetical protein